MLFSVRIRQWMNHEGYKHTNRFVKYIFEMLYEMKKWNYVPFSRSVIRYKLYKMHFSLIVKGRYITFLLPLYRNSLFCIPWPFKDEGTFNSSSIDQQLYVYTFVLFPKHDLFFHCVWFLQTPALLTMYTKPRLNIM